MSLALVDKFGREHQYLRISLTEKCNLRCTYCMPEHGIPLTAKENLMTADEIYRIANIFTELGVNKIRLTGGEPLVRKDFGNIILKLKKLNIPLTLTSNALLINRHIQSLKDAGVHSINVSLDTLKQDRFKEFTRRDHFKKTIDNIELLIKKGFHVKLNVVSIRDQNTDEITDFVEWTRNKPIHIRFIEFMPFDGNNWQWDKIYSYKEILDDIEGKFDIEKLKDDKHDTAKAFRVIGYQGTFAVISSMTDHFCGSCNRLRLTADGRLRNCLFSNDETDLLGPLRRGEDVVSLIKECLKNKKFKHGGIDELKGLDSSSPEFSKRSMIQIGG